MKKPVKHFDFNRVEDARKFLAGFRLNNGARVTHVIVEGEKKVDFNKATDDQLMDFASQIYTEIYVPSRGSSAPCYYEEEELH